MADKFLFALDLPSDHEIDEFLVSEGVLIRSILANRGPGRGSISSESALPTVSRLTGGRVATSPCVSSILVYMLTGSRSS